MREQTVNVDVSKPLRVVSCCLVTTKLHSGRLITALVVAAAVASWIMLTKTSWFSAMVGFGPPLLLGGPPRPRPRPSGGPFFFAGGGTMGKPGSPYFFVMPVHSLSNLPSHLSRNESVTTLTFEGAFVV